MICAYITRCTQNWNVEFHKISIPPRGRSLEIPRGMGVSKAKYFKGKYETKLEFPEGWGIENQKPSVGGVWIFSGTTQFGKNRCIMLLEFLKTT